MVSIYSSHWYFVWKSLPVTSVASDFSNWLDTVPNISPYYFGKNERKSLCADPGCQSDCDSGHDTALVFNIATPLGVIFDACLSVSKFQRLFDVIPVYACYYKKPWSGVRKGFTLIWNFDIKRLDKHIEHIIFEESPDIEIWTTTILRK